MPIYGADPINFEGVNGDRYWFYEHYAYTGVADIDDRLSGFPVAVFLPPHPRQDTPLVIGLQGMCAPYGLNAFIVPTLTQMGIAVALFDTPFAGERSLVRTFTAKLEKEIQPLIDRGIPFDTKLLLHLFRKNADDVNKVHELCRQRYGVGDSKLALFGVSMGVLETAYCFTAHGIGERLLGTIGHADLAYFAKTWGGGMIPDLTASPLGKIAANIAQLLQPDTKTIINLLQLVKNLKDPDEFAIACNPMTYIDQVESHRKVRFLVGHNDLIVNTQDAKNCAQKFPDGECYIVPGMGHGTRQWGPTFVDHVRYFIRTQLSDW
ncbi:MAG: alpha/beta hydrolase [Cuspidothrix sp.]